MKHLSYETIALQAIRLGLQIMKYSKRRDNHTRQLGIKRKVLKWVWVNMISLLHYTKAMDKLNRKQLFSVSVNMKICILIYVVVSK